jgi:hypothetical protein
MKKLTLLLLLVTAPALPGIGVTISHQAVGAAFPSARSDALPLYQLAVDHPTTALDEKNHGDNRRGFPYGQTQEPEMKRLKLIFLLMMSLEQYRSPGR